MLYTCFYKSPLGGITMASNGNALTGLWFDGQKYFAEGLAETAAAKTLPVFEQPSAKKYGSCCCKFPTAKPLLTANLLRSLPRIKA